MLQQSGINENVRVMYIVFSSAQVDNQRWTQSGSLLSIDFVRREIAWACVRCTSSLYKHTFAHDDEETKTRVA